jgi:ankyrin repeat protein
MKQLTVVIAFMSLFFCQAQQKQKDVFDTARGGTVEEMKALEAQNKDIINELNPAGFTPLILACYRGNNEVAAYLAPKVKDINYNSSNGTALAAAAVKGNAGMAKILLDNKANPNIADPSGLTPIMYATQFENKELIQLLIKYKADLTKKDSEGRTPYDYAVFTKNPEIINLLKK